MSKLWAKTDIGDQLDAYWRASPDEMAYRRMLAALVHQETRTAETILEVGCGTGLIYEALRLQIGAGLNYVGVDNSKAMLTVAQRNFPAGHFRRGHAQTLPFEDNTFDVAVAFEVFGHLPDITAAIAELIRVARRTAIFTLWITAEKTRQDGEDHYEYPAWQVSTILGDILHDSAGGGWREQDMPWTRAYIIKKADRSGN